jgi:hypothetical protein
MTIEETLHSIKLRLQDQQSEIGADRELAKVRAELDALWACVEVLAQAVDGREEIEVPNYFGDKKRRFRGARFPWRKSI